MEWFSTSLMIQGVKTVHANLARARTIPDVVKDLRLLRFEDDGILIAIDEIIQGDPCARDKLIKHLVDFNDREWIVADALARLVEQCNDISRISRDDLQLIQWRKPSIRADLQNALNHYGQPDTEIDILQLKRIRESIDDLNKAIDEVEDALLHGRKG